MESLSLSLYIYIYISIVGNRSIDRSFDLVIYRSIDLSIYRSIDLSIYLSIDRSIDRSIGRSSDLPEYLSMQLLLCFTITRQCAACRTLLSTANYCRTSCTVCLQYGLSQTRPKWFESATRAMQSPTRSGKQPMQECNAGREQ